MAGPYTYDLAFANGPFTSGVAAALNDVSTYNPMTLPAGSFVTKVFFNSGTFPSDGTISVGWSGNLDGIVPASAGITAYALNAAGVLYRPADTVAATTADHQVVVSFNSNISSGQVNVGLEYISYANLPDTV